MPLALPIADLSDTQDRQALQVGPAWPQAEWETHIGPMMQLRSALNKCH